MDKIESVPSIVVHYQELALKGRNRPWFVSTLVRSMRLALSGLGDVEVRSVMGRIEVALSDARAWPEARERLAGLPGIANFALATHVALPNHAIAPGNHPAPPSARSPRGDAGAGRDHAILDPLGAAILDAVAGRQVESFAIAARRADKRFPVASPDIERDLGARVQAATGWRVSLTRPALTVHVEVLTDEAFFFLDKARGAGGLPVGTSGRVLALLSGGIDSPVAAWRMMRRGCRVDFVHFHSYPILARTSQDKARELAARLTRHELRSRLYLVPFGGVQQRVILAVPPPLRVVIYRRLMLRIAERLADRLGAHALVTGEVVGQVASQTIENLAVIGAVASRPLLRPLLGFDKDEITAEAERLGTYEVSIIPDEDCCTLFTPRFPATRATREKVEAAERELDVPALVEMALEGVETGDFRFPPRAPRAHAAVGGRG